MIYYYIPTASVNALYERPQRDKRKSSDRLNPLSSSHRPIRFALSHLTKRPSCFALSHGFSFAKKGKNSLSPGTPEIAEERWPKES